MFTSRRVVNVGAQCFSIFETIPRIDVFLRQEKTPKDSKQQLKLETVRQSSLLHLSGLISVLGLTLSLSTLNLPESLKQSC